MYPDNKVNLWSHYMRVHNGVGSVILFGKPYLWIDVSSEGYGNISNIGLEIQHMFDYYNQAAYLTWEIRPSDFMKLLFKITPCGVTGKTSKKDGYYVVCEEDYNLIYDIMRIQSYECMFPECGHVYDCFPSAEMMNSHHANSHPLLINRTHDCI